MEEMGGRGDEGEAVEVGWGEWGWSGWEREEMWVEGEGVEGGVEEM